jgi:hypothetical protein
MDEEKTKKVANEQKEPDYSRILLKLEQWLLFTVLVALVPLGLDALKQIGDGIIPSFDTLISNGELALISATIAGEIIGEIAISGKTKGGLTYLTFGICFLLFFLAAGVYVLAKNHSLKYPNAYVGVSLLIYLFIITAGFGSKILVEIKNVL